MLTFAILLSINSWSNTFLAIVHFFLIWMESGADANPSSCLLAFPEVHCRHFCQIVQICSAEFLTSSSFTLKWNELHSNYISWSTLSLCCFKLFPYNTFLTFFICFTRHFLIINVPWLILCKRIVQCSEYMPSRSRLAIVLKSGFFRESGKVRDWIPPARQERQHSKAMSWLVISEDCSFLITLLVLRAVPVINYKMKVKICYLHLILYRQTL